MDYTTLQRIALGVIEASAACDGQMFTGKVTSASPLKIKLGEEAGGIELDGDDIILTESVVSKKLYIKKHLHTEEKALNDCVAYGNLGAPVIFTPVGFDPANLYVVNPNFNPNLPRTDTDDVKGTGTNPYYIVNPAIPNPTTLMLNHSHGIHDVTLDGWVTEYGHRLPRDPEDYDAGGDQICLTINRSLEEGDSVIMSRVSHGQQFIVLSRYFPVDEQGEDDN